MLDKFENQVHASVDLQIRKILVPIDCSEGSSYNATSFAVALAKKYNSEVCLVGIISTNIWNYFMMPNEGSTAPLYLMRRIEEEGRQTLLSASRLVEENSICTSVQMSYGRPASKILEVVKRRNIDLIVMENDSPDIFTRLFCGSTCTDIINNAPCPVLVVNDKCKGGCPHENSKSRHM